ncbi:MAG: hypothetical protein HP494_11225 [Nitrospira sp.]|nr:hypothetical protein [Nitrospira sp.]MBH0196139.1 hypothetical protein [Nitrospira sp.]
MASALGKSMDFQGFVEILNTYRFFPDGGLWLVAIGMTGLEWVLALWILSGWRIERGAFITLILYGLYAAGLVITLLRGLGLPNCGCYGVFFPQLLRWYSPLEDLVLAGMCYAVWLSARNAGRPIDTSF